MKRKIDFPEWLNWRFIIKFLRLLMEKQATYGEASHIQRSIMDTENTGGSESEPQPKTRGQILQNAGHHFLLLLLLLCVSCSVMSDSLQPLRL